MFIKSFENFLKQEIYEKFEKLLKQARSYKKLYKLLKQSKVKQANKRFEKSFRNF